MVKPIIPFYPVSLTAVDTVQITPNVDLIQDTAYYAVITPGLETVGGSHFTNDFIWSFSTIPPMAASITNFPDNGDTGIYLLSSRRTWTRTRSVRSIFI
ncbi:Ig-like domain-containing protein [Spirochaetota bacterium]